MTAADPDPPPSHDTSSINEALEHADAGSLTEQDKASLRAAEAHAYLGLLALPPPDASASDPSYERARGEFQAALTASDRAPSMDPKRRALFEYYLGFALAQQGQTAAADAAYGQAIQLDPSSPIYSHARQQLHTDSDP